MAKTLSTKKQQANRTRERIGRRKYEGYATAQLNIKNTSSIRNRALIVFVSHAKNLIINILSFLEKREISCIFHNILLYIIALRNYCVTVYAFCNFIYAIFVTTPLV